MSVESSRPIVASGKPYAVTTPPAADSPSLDQFLGDVEFTIDGTGGPLLLKGHGIALEDVVRFHEKSEIGGKDVRVWHVSRRDGGFVAEHIAAF
jgi:hypothetical protein